MDKEKILARLNSKDYNNELEIILEEKNFSEDVKNLLLSMLYKIEAGYTDYMVVKRMVEDRKSYIETILTIIKEKANKIEIIKEETQEGKEILESGNHYKIDKMEQSIKMLHPNEKTLLYALYELDDRQIYLDEKYTLIRMSLSKVLNLGENINNTEILRDFNGWSWNTLPNEIGDIYCNLIYQNLIYLLGIEFMQEWIHSDQVRDLIKELEEKLEQNYGEENTKKILKQIYLLSILIVTQKDEREKQNLLEQKADLQKELIRLNNKRALLEEISTTKKEALGEIKEIDSILNDKKRLEEEYIKRNQERPEYNKIFSLTHLTEILARQRKKYIIAMEEANKILDPTYYVEAKTNLERQLELLEKIELEQEEIEKQKQLHLKTIQELFLDCFAIKIKQLSQKEEIIDALYMLRYYGLLYFSPQEQIYQISSLEEKRQKLIQEVIQKGQTIKAIVLLTQEEEMDEIVWQRIIKSRLINLESIQVQISIKESNTQIEIYDTDILEETVETKTKEKKQLLVKPNKKVKLLM